MCSLNTIILRGYYVQSTVLDLSNGGAQALQFSFHESRIRELEDTGAHLYVHPEQVEACH